VYEMKLLKYHLRCGALPSNRDRQNYSEVHGSNVVGSGWHSCFVSVRSQVRLSAGSSVLVFHYSVLRINVGEVFIGPFRATASVSKQDCHYLSVSVLLLWV
jgi:hypothetical protein